MFGLFGKRIPTSDVMFTTRDKSIGDKFRDLLTSRDWAMAAIIALLKARYSRPQANIVIINVDDLALFPGENGFVITVDCGRGHRDCQRYEVELAPMTGHGIFRPRGQRYLKVIGERRLR